MQNSRGRPTKLINNSAWPNDFGKHWHTTHDTHLCGGTHLLLARCELGIFSLSEASLVGLLVLSQLADHLGVLLGQVCSGRARERPLAKVGADLRAACAQTHHRHQPQLGNVDEGRPQVFSVPIGSN